MYYNQISYLQNNNFQQNLQCHKPLNKTNL